VSFNESISSDFINKYGKPSDADNNYEYISGGIVNMVQEFTKTLLTYFDVELSGSTQDVINSIENSISNKESI